MDKMIKSAGDQAIEVVEVQQLIAKLIRVGKGTKGRQMILMVLESFRSYDRLDLVFGGGGLRSLLESKSSPFRKRKLKGNPQELELDLNLYEHMERRENAYLFAQHD